MATRIILVDEYPLLRQELRTLLEKEPDFAVVVEVDTVEAAVRLAPEVKPDVVVLSLAVTRKGLDPVHQLKFAIPSAKVIALSMHADRRFILEVIKAGAIGYVLKEHAYEELVPAIRAVQSLNTYISRSLFSMAGGIAHDFSNILIAIQKNIALAMSDEKPESKVRERLAQVEKASPGAQDLGQKNIALAMSDEKPEPKVRDRLAQAEKAPQGAQDPGQKLLAFVPVGAPTKKIVSVPTLLKGSATVTWTQSGCELLIADNLWPVKADEGQLNQVIGNLLINADQAMPKGGMIKVRAENILAEEEPDLPISTGKYVRITFADEGTGIPAEYLDNIFDPDFSSQGQGKGMGLATTYAIIKKHAGYIKVESQEGVGTTFHIYLPAMETEAPAVILENLKTRVSGDSGGE